METKVKPLHFTEAYGIAKSESDLDFFDVNLLYDTRAFIDPFLIKRSPREVERELFKRFGDYFRRAYEISAASELTRGDYDRLREYLEIPEPRAIGLGYTEVSHSGSGPGKSFTDRLTEFFLESAARKFLRETEVFQDQEFNPVTLDIFVDRLGPDGISDISANLLMDYLVSYTQEQCESLGISTKELALNTDGFDFENQEWRGGGYYELPENPLRPGTPVVLVPKRFLRGYDMDGESAQSAVKGILATDVRLKKKFSNLLARDVSNIPMSEVRAVFLEENGVFKRYLEHLQTVRSEAYDFVKDINWLMALKKFSHIFDNAEYTEEIKDCNGLFELTQRYLSLVSDHFARSDGWKDAWNEDSGTPRKEEAIGRVVRAMGISFFDRYPKITFEAQVNMGSGPVDFKIIFLECRIVIELKKLSNSSPAGKNPPLPAYQHGMKRQLPAYAYDSKATHAVYLTIQNYTSASKPKGHHDKRVVELESMRPEVEAEMKKDRKEFLSLLYLNVLAIPRKSASEL